MHFSAATIIMKRTAAAPSEEHRAGTTDVETRPAADHNITGKPTSKEEIETITFKCSEICEISGGDPSKCHAVTKADHNLNGVCQVINSDTGRVITQISCLNFKTDRPAMAAYQICAELHSLGAQKTDLQKCMPSA